MAALMVVMTGLLMVATMVVKKVVCWDGLSAVRLVAGLVV